ncbi:hypothetical protein SprV_0501828800 [Sparganum proliferum]
MRQESNQCVSDFITNLTLAIQDCGYKEIKADNFEHAMLVQQLIVGLRNEKARESLLSEKKDLSWEKACDIASHQERVRQNLQQLNQSNGGVIASLESEIAVSLVNTAVSSPRQRPSAPSKQLPSCYRCGQHHIRWSDCRHQKTVCQFCKKIGHIERVCFSKRRANTNTHATYPNPAEDGEAILRMFSANALLQSPYTITLPVDHHPVKFEIDTGSAVTLINEASLQKLPSLLPASSTFRSYTGQNVEVRGVFTAEVEHDGELHYLPVHVVRGSQQPNLPVLSYVHRIGANPALDSILVNHKDLFRDDSATHYRGPPVKFQFQSDFRPRFFKARTVPYAVAPKVEEELDRLQKADIIEPLQYSEWAAPIVPVLKSDGSVRICGDYKLTINSATKLNPYPLPRIEDLYASLAGGHQFTTLDLKHAYNQVVLDTESRDATTINTHRGLFRYKRLPFGGKLAGSLRGGEAGSLLVKTAPTAVDQKVESGREVCTRNGTRDVGNDEESREETPEFDVRGGRGGKYRGGVDGLKEEAEVGGRMVGCCRRDGSQLCGSVDQETSATPVVADAEGATRTREAREVGLIYSPV